MSDTSVSRPCSSGQVPLGKLLGALDDADRAYGEAEVQMSDGTLVLRWSSFLCSLEHFHYDTFTARSQLLGDPEVRFTLGSDGQR